MTSWRTSHHLRSSNWTTKLPRSFAFKPTTLVGPTRFGLVKKTWWMNGYCVVGNKSLFSLATRLCWWSTKPNIWGQTAVYSVYVYADMTASYLSYLPVHRHRHWSALCYWTGSIEGWGRGSPLIEKAELVINCWFKKNKSFVTPVH